MKKTINFYDFEQAFKNYGRQDQFSYYGLKALFEYLEDLEQDTGEELELDVIALCCDFSEYTIDELKSDFDFEKFKKEYIEDNEEAEEEEIEEAFLNDENQEAIISILDNGSYLLRNN